MRIKEYASELIDGKQLSHQSIYVLSLIGLERLKTYIQSYPKTGFIQSFKFFVEDLILIDKKPNNSFGLYIN